MEAQLKTASRIQPLFGISAGIQGDLFSIFCSAQFILLDY